jgi:hypothetical protein
LVNTPSYVSSWATVAKPITGVILNLSHKPTSADFASICDREFNELEAGADWRQLVLGVMVLAGTACAAWWLLMPGGA